jgi:hypothetical protein
MEAKLAARCSSTLLLLQLLAIKLLPKELLNIKLSSPKPLAARHQIAGTIM